MIQLAHGLTDPALEAISDLERRVLAADGGRLKLEWGTLHSRPESEVRDLLWWEGDQLLGFLGIYGFNWPWLEVTGMVDPTARRGGIGRALFEAALPLCRASAKERLLMVVPRGSASGHDLAGALGMSYEHSEHALTLTQRPEDLDGDPRLSIRQASVSDLPDLSELFLDGFGEEHIDPERLTGDRSRMLMVQRDGQTVGTVSITRDGGRGAVYGFVIGSRWRGQGFGREVLRRACRELFDAGADHVDLEVEVTNDSALGLYRSVGFTPVATDDYFELPLV